MNRPEIREHLRKLGNGEIQPVNQKKGICFELYARLGIGTSRVCLALQEWPGHSTEFLHPIGGGLEEYKDYTDVKNMWDPEDAYGALRLEACRWLAENFEAKALTYA